MPGMACAIGRALTGKRSPRIPRTQGVQGAAAAPATSSTTSTTHGRPCARSARDAADAGAAGGLGGFFQGVCLGVGPHGATVVGAQKLADGVLHHQSRADVQNALQEAACFYNHVRLHQNLKGLTPKEAWDELAPGDLQQGAHDTLFVQTLDGCFAIIGSGVKA
ncbi:hypothetical protein EBQ25_03820 [Allofranklinella schreckenbergeri]|uniref:Uncharacterized protein n=2 Tax=Allofranklinella schreckenbergeri TaxID=1076744 RepID=A0A3M6QD13_9BURK|nr:hypothetical protein EBQ25_03820 [Allofranklinella schreckenbergeri]